MASGTTSCTPDLLLHDLQGYLHVPQVLACGEQLEIIWLEDRVIEFLLGED